ncbi:MAG: protein kinase [Pyrinomonadaceae bacterium]
MVSLDPQKWPRAKEIFHAALDLQRDDRGRFLDEQCGTDDDLRREVLSLLDSSDLVGSFLQDDAAASALPASHTLHPGKTFSHYTIKKLLGKGGMGEVYLASDEMLKRNVAVKFLPAKLTGDKDVSRRFQQEAFAASALNHPNILTIYEIGEADGSSFIASEFIDGETLREKLSRGILAVEESLDIAVQTAAALSVAHEAGIIHRDIKPENIMVRGDGLVKVLDFGLAKLSVGLLGATSDAETQPHLQTQSGFIMGTAGYMSPEQARAQKVDARTDVWSLGVVLYEMISGRQPFSGETVTDSIVAIVDKDPPSLKDIAPVSIPDGLDQIVTRALRKKPDERHPSARELHNDLKALRRTIEIEFHLGHSGRSLEEGARTMRLAVETPAASAGSSGIFSRRPYVVLAVAVVLIVLSTAGFYMWRMRPAAQTAATEIKSLAVLPLKSLDTGENYLGLGITDAVIRRISQTGELIVRPTSAVRRYLNPDTDALSAAQELNVDAVLDGSVQRADDRLRVTINLLRVSDGRSLGTDQFDLQVTDIFAMQDAVAQKVVSRLRLQLDPAQQARLTKHSTSNSTAYEFYLKGIYNLDQRLTQDKARAEVTVDFFKKAIDADPDFALAYAQLAYAYALLAVFIDPTEVSWAPLAKTAADRAESLDPQLAETHIARFQLLFSEFGGYKDGAAIREVVLAQKLDPNVGHEHLGYLFAHVGIEDLADIELQRAAEIDPTSEFIKQITLNMYLINGRYDDWLAGYEKLYPGAPPNDVAYFLGAGHLEDAQKAIDETQKTIEAGTAIPLLAAELPAKRAILHALKGEFAAAESEIPNILAKYPAKDPTYHHATYDIAAVYALEGKTAEALKWLRETVATGFQPYERIKRDPFLDRIRGSSEFIQFAAEMKAQNERYREEFRPETIR